MNKYFFLNKIDDIFFNNRRLDIKIYQLRNFGLLKEKHLVESNSSVSI